MNDIPREILSEHFESRLSGLRPLAAVFLTYQFEPGFFEKEVLPILFDIPGGHVEAVRLLRLDDELRKLKGGVAVYYDRGGLVASDAGSSQLDVRRIPVKRETGIFHPKNVLILAEDRDADENGQRARKLIVGSMSANLTRAGWWENVEACHVEVVEEADRTRIRDDLLGLLAIVHRMAAPGTDQSALEEIRRFLRWNTGGTKHKSFHRLHPHLFLGDREDLLDFLGRVAGRRIEGCYLEVISPYFDNARRCDPLERLVDRFDIREARVFLPRGADGTAAVNERLFESVKAHPRLSWARLPDEATRAGKSADAEDRFVHAKVYRFFRQNPKFEVLLVGSVNLTQAAHRAGGNLETAFLFEHEPPRRPDFWLVTDSRRPREFAPRGEADDSATHRGVPLVIRYSWQTACAEAWWEADRSSPELRLRASGLDLATLRSLSARKWERLDGDFAARLRDVLANTSFLEVLGAGKEPGLILVQEEGMSHKPSLGLRLSARDILEYWAMFTEEQRQQFLEYRYAELRAVPGSEHVIPAAVDLGERGTFFDRFAGIFHSFGCLGDGIRAGLREGRERDAECRLFGRKLDSLGQLLTKVLDQGEFEDPVDRYVLLLCARQLLKEVARDFPDFWRSHANDAAVLDQQLSRISEVRAEIVADDPEGMPRFLEWFDEMFLARAEAPEPVEVE